MLGSARDEADFIFIFTLRHSKDEDGPRTIMLSERFWICAFVGNRRVGWLPYLVSAVAGEVAELGQVGIEAKLNRADRAVALFADDDLG